MTLAFTRRIGVILQLSAYCIFSSLPTTADDPPQGQLTGGVKYEIPGWFKESFLDLAEDVEEAAAEDKHVLLYFHLDECPYCEKMLQDSFIQSDYSNFIRDNFDSIAINIRGDRVVAYNAETELTEQMLSKQLKVRYTPTIIFLDPRLNNVLRLNGYRSPSQFKHALDFIQQRAYQETDFAAYLASREKSAVYALRDHPLFRPITDFSNLNGSVMLIFESAACDTCATLHDKLFSAPQTLAEMEKFTVVRFDADSEQPLVDFEGNPTTPRDWTRQSDLTYRPGILLFDQGKEIDRIDGLLYGYHFNSVLRYVADKLYERYPTRNDYSRAYREELLKAGKTIDYSSYDQPILEPDS